MENEIAAYVKHPTAKILIARQAQPFCGFRISAAGMADYVLPSRAGNF